jgi:long-chain acyl-CoA synthetase
MESKNDKIAVISSSNRTEWNIMDIGVLQTGAQNVPIYPTITEDDYEYILNHSGAILVLYLMQRYFKSKFNKDKVPNLKEVFSFNPIEGCKNWKELLLLGKDQSNQTDVDTSKSLVKPEDTIIYTSGRQVDQKELCSLMITSFQTY